MAQNGLFPVTYTRHQHRYWRRFTSFEFAADRAECAVVMPEILQIAAAFPIVFKTSERGIEPLALLSLPPHTRTPFVSQDGRWLAAYIPSALRCHPFRAEGVSPQSLKQIRQFVLCVDETSELVTSNPDDQAFFDESGRLSPELQEVQIFLQARQSAIETTAHLCQTLDALGLFEPIEQHAGVDLPPGALGIAPLRLQRLSQPEKVILVDSGAFQLIHAHQISLTHCAWLTRAQQQLAQQVFPEKYTENSDISGFLYAVANAQNDVFFRTNEV